MKGDFIAKYAECTIQIPPAYRVKNASGLVVFCVDCVYRKTKRATGRRCDEFVFFDINRNVTGLYLIERKIHAVNIEKVKEQLQGGAKFIANFLHDDPALDKCVFNFKPVFVSRGITSSQRAKLAALKVELNRQRKRIFYVQYGKALPKIQT